MYYVNLVYAYENGENGVYHAFEAIDPKQKTTRKIIKNLAEMLDLTPTHPNFYHNTMQICLPNSVIDKIKTDARKEQNAATADTAYAIMECFENLLESHHIMIPDDDRPAGNDAPLYGCTYGDLFDAIHTILMEEK